MSDLQSRIADLKYKNAVLVEQLAQILIDIPAQSCMIVEGG